MKKYLLKVIPKSLITMIKSSGNYHKMEAKKLAQTSKRLDICAAQIAQLLHLSKYGSLSGKTCLEVGCGWTLSHSVVFHLLGAKKIIATDIFPHLFLKSLHYSIHSSVTSIVRDILSPFEEHHLIRKRLDNLLSISEFTVDELRNLGIEYIAPIDFNDTRLNIPIDFIYSNSVFEHIPYEDLEEILLNLTVDLNPNGVMLNCIHLEDHQNFYYKPFDFLSIPSNEYSRIDQTLRGNRIRRSTWQKIFSNIKNAESTFIYEWSRQDKDIPKIIENSISYENEEDLRISHLGVLTKKINKES